jgi:hypothetical protein
MDHQGISEMVKGGICILLGWISMISHWTIALTGDIGSIMLLLLSNLGSIAAILGITLALHGLWKAVIRCIYITKKYGWKGIFMYINEDD